MSTTPVIAEIIVTGFFSMIWILIFIFKGFCIQSFELNAFLKEYKDWSSLFIIIIMIIWYQIGWLINSLGSVIIEDLVGHYMRNKIFGKNKGIYEDIRATFYQFASNDLRNDIEYDRTITRLDRGGIINFILIFVALLVLGGIFIKVSFIFLLLAIGSSIQWQYRYRRYYKRMKVAYEVIRSK